MSNPTSQQKPPNNLLPRYHQNKNMAKQSKTRQTTIQISPPTSHSSQSSQSSHSSHSSSPQLHSNTMNKKNRKPPQIPPKLYPNHHQPSLPHLRPSTRVTGMPKTSLQHSNSSISLTPKPKPKPKPKLSRSTKIKRTHSHESTSITTNNTNTHNNNNNNNNLKKQPLFYQIQHDLNAYIQRFLFNASKKYWYSNEYSASRDMIACTPLSTDGLLSIHKKSYMESILNDEARVTNKSHIHMIDARIGASYDNVYNGIYGVFQTFVDKNNHISFIYNDKVVTDKISQINLLHVVSNNINWKQYSNKLIKELNKQLIGPYKSYALDKFKKCLQKEFKTLSVILFLYKSGDSTKKIYNNNNNNNNNTSIINDSMNDHDDNDNKKGHLISLLQQQLNNTDDDCTKGINEKIAICKVNEFHKELTRDLNIDTNKLVEKNNKIISNIKNEDNYGKDDKKEKSKEREKSKHIKLVIEEYVGSTNDISLLRIKSYNLMKKYVQYLYTSTNASSTSTSQSTSQSKILIKEIDTLLNKNKELIIYGKQLLDYKYECILYNEHLIKLKKEFHGKNKRFKKEIKDRITIIKEFDLNNMKQNEANYLSISAKISSIIRFSKHNIKAGTMEILLTMLNNIKNICPPGEHEGDNNSINCNEIYECNLKHESIVLELEKQQDLCDKLLCKLQDYSIKKQKKLYSKMKQIGMLDKDKGDGGDGGDGERKLEEHEYHCDNVIFRVNETGQYDKRFLMVIWKNKIYRVFTSEISWRNGKVPLIEAHFRATDYGYNGHMTVDVRRSNKTKKTSRYQGYQFILAKHAFVVKDMLDIKYWRNYIQRGENLRKASEDWQAHNHYIKNRYNDENDVNYNNTRDRRSRYVRKTRSSSLI